MAKTIKDTDYLVISARVKALETGLLTAERMEQILDAKSGEDAGKLLQEWGYPQLDPRRPEAMDAALSAVREATLADLAEGTPDARYIDLFKVKYDYHNVKALLKAEAVGTAPDRMLMDMGRVSTAELAEAVRSRELDGLPETLAAAVAEAREVLDTTRDPQLSDIVLDRWCYRDMAALAEETGSAFLRGGRRCGRCAWERGRTSSWARCWRGETSLRMQWQRPPPAGPRACGSSTAPPVSATPRRQGQRP